MTAYRESTTLLWVKIALFAAAIWIGIARLASLPGEIAAVLAVVLAGLQARYWAASKLRTLPAVLIGLCAVLLGLGGNFFVRNIWGFSLAARNIIQLADIILFFWISFGVVFALRFVAARHRSFAVLELVLVLFSIASACVAHRGLHLDQPRFLSDFALVNGLDPQDLMMGIGIFGGCVSAFLLLRVEGRFKLWTTLLVVLLLGVLVFWLRSAIPVKPVVETGLGLTEDDQNGDDQDERNNGDSSNEKGDSQQGGGQSKNRDDDSGKKKNKNKNQNKNQQPPPYPVAIAVFHTDFEPQSGVMYFRQQVLSHYDGNHLVADTSGLYDQDVLTAFPVDESLVAQPVQTPAFHVEVPTSMYLLTEHPQPPALSASTMLSPLDNPDSQRFVAAYEVRSLVLNVPIQRLAGRKSVPDSWSAEQRAHYLQTPDDPRYAALAEEIVREVDPRFLSDEMIRALAIKRWLEKNGFYTRKEKHVDWEDPVASFLFGNLRGYCVHFAHSAVQLLRSQGIAARVAIGYAVDTMTRGSSSTVLILADRAHAWPEIYVDGVGWVTFDIYPERSDEVPQEVVDQSLESLLGELARRDQSGGRSADPSNFKLEIPWKTIGIVLLLLLALLLVSAYIIKIYRLLAYRFASSEERGRLMYRASLDRLTAVGLGRQIYELREAHAKRIDWPAFTALTNAFLQLKLGRDLQALETMQTAYSEFNAVFSNKISLGRRLLGAIDPLSWWRTK